MDGETKNALNELAAENGSKMEVVTRRVAIKPEVIERMKRFYPLFADNIAENAKETDIISFFLDKTFELFVASGEIEKRVLEIAGKG
jgi:hypothetical protein